jgi:hypothetical protein
MTLDRRTCTDIIVATAPVAAIISSAVVTGGAIITISSVVGVPAVVSVIVFVGRPDAQETPCRRVLLSRLVVFLLFRGAVVPIPRLVLVFQVPIEKELEILTIGQGLIAL